MGSAFKVSEFHGPDEAGEIKHVIEYQAGRRNFRGRPGGRTGEAVPNTGGEYCREEGQDEDVTQLLRPGADGPAEAHDERQNTSVEEDVQLEKQGEGFSTGEARQEYVLLWRYNAVLLPLLQSGEYCHEVVLGPAKWIRRLACDQGATLRPMSAPILHCNRQVRAENTVEEHQANCR